MAYYNYRRASSGQLTCWDCCYRTKPNKRGNRIRCVIDHWRPIVGRKMCCDRLELDEMHGDDGRQTGTSTMREMALKVYKSKVGSGGG